MAAPTKINPLLAVIPSNVIKRILPVNCAPQPEVWAEIVLAGVNNMGFSILEPDKKAVYHDIRGHSATCSVKMALQETEVLDPLVDSQGKRFLFQSAEWADMYLWYTFLFGSYKNGLVRWGSQILKHECTTGHKSPYYGQGGAYFGGLDKHGRWQTADFTMNEGSIFYPVSDSRIVLKPGHSGFVAAHATWELAHPDTTGFVTGRVINETTGDLLDFDADNISILDGASTMLFAHHTNATDEDVAISAQWSFAGNQSEPGTAALLHEGHCSKYALI